MGLKEYIQSGFGNPLLGKHSWECGNTVFNLLFVDRTGQLHLLREIGMRVDPRRSNPRRTVMNCCSFESNFRALMGPWGSERGQEGKLEKARCQASHHRGQAELHPTEEPTWASVENASEFSCLRVR